MRPALESDRAGIASVIVEAYRHEFSTLSRNTDNIAAALAPAVEVDRFFVAERGGDVVGAIACTDHSGRAMRIRPRTGAATSAWCEASLPPESWLRSGCLSSSIRRDGLPRVRRRRRAGPTPRRRHQARRGVIAQTPYTGFELEVTDVNVAARDCYRKIGFVDVKRKKEKFSRINGFRERIYMQYPR